MKELSLNILDIAENSVKAGATLTEIRLVDTADTRTLTITYTPAQGRALIDFLRRSGIADELT